MYKAPEIGKTSVTYADGRCTALGTMVDALVEVTPREAKVICRFRPPCKKSHRACRTRSSAWPLYLRHLEELFAYDVRATTAK